MDNVIERVLEADRVARERTADAEQKCKNMLADIGRKRQEITDLSLSESKEKIKLLSQQKNDDADKMIEKVKAQQAVDLKKLNDRYKKSKDRWVSHITEKVTEVDYSGRS